LITGFSLAAVALFVVFFGTPGWRRQRVDAHSTVTADSTPVADGAAPAAPLEEQLLDASSTDESGDAANELAQADPVHAPDTSPPGQDSTPIPKPPPVSRFGFDLEHGTPMPPEAREPKPVY
jgi:hypothetical protein